MRVSLPHVSLLVLSAWSARLACTQLALAGSLGEWRPVAVHSAVVQPAVAWQSFGKSVERRPLQFARWGSGERLVLVMGPLAGDRREALGLIDKLVAYLAKARLVPGVRVIVVRDPNPDGRARGWPYNARAVDLDANFPTAGWRKTPRADRWTSGRVPKSEPETRALVRFLRETRPQRVVFISTGTRRNSVGYLGTGEAIARNAAAAADLPLWPFNIASHPASCPAYAGDELGLPVVLLMCRPRASADENWQALCKALVLLLELEPHADAPVDTPAGSDGSQPSRGRAALAAQRMLHTATEPAPGLHGEKPMIDVHAAQPLAAAGLETVPPRSAQSAARQPVRFAERGDVLADNRQPVSAAPLAPNDRARNRAGGERLRYLLPFTSAARRARESRVAELRRLAHANQVTDIEDMATEGDDRLMPVVSPRAARGLFIAASGQAVSHGHAAIAGPAIERLPPVDAPAAAGALAKSSPWQASDGHPVRYPSTDWPD